MYASYFVSESACVILREKTACTQAKLTRARTPFKIHNIFHCERNVLKAKKMQDMASHGEFYTFISAVLLLFLSFIKFIYCKLQISVFSKILCAAQHLLTC